jgi:type I restriction enzyme R subunit
MDDNGGPTATTLQGGALVHSLNFEFLRPHVELLADLGGFAEKYAHGDPQSAAVKLRSFTEELVEQFYERHKLPRPYDAHLVDLLADHSFTSAAPSVIQNLLHALRKTGNKGAHGDLIATETVLRRLEDALQVARWFFVSVLGQDVALTPQVFREPPPESTKTLFKKKNKQLQQELAKQREIKAQQEAELAKLQAELKSEREKAANAEAAKKEAEKQWAKTDEELAAIREQGEHVAVGVLQLNEEATRRRLIDETLVDVGWDVGANGKNTEEVGQEVVVHGLPKGYATGTNGEGRCDYVLWDDNGKPLAVVEAKRTSKDPEAGRTQAQMYAGALEKEYGQRPVIFYTNGAEIFIEDDAQGYPPRRLFAFYSKGSLQTLHFQRREKLDLAGLAPSPTIAGRMYQVEAVKRVCERFTLKHRRSLIVQATGTGKTRVAISLCDVLSRARWAKRVLFLCDRRELRKQAINAFKEHLPNEPRTIVDRASLGDTKHRVFVGTYPAMMNVFQSFDPGFFDLIVADESHRSIYNKYRDLFLYFDALQVGLTATPVKFVERNTYRLFGCTDQDPTFNYEYSDAVSNDPPYLVPFRVVRVTTRFLREGIKYSQMTPEQRAELEADIDKAEEVEFEKNEIDKQVFNKDTNRVILRNLMDHGLRDASGSRPGKSIIFARNHAHAKLMDQVFQELYPQYGGSFSRVIDNYDPNAEALIDHFKDPANELTIAISVDMLDTGIDIPQVVNLVFAKPVKSYVKFWQMIGRGTRLCPDLFGPGQDKNEFLVFDHWGNFEFFEERYQEKQPSVSRSLLQQVFEARLELVDAAVQVADQATVDRTVGLITQMVRAVSNTGAIAAKERWKQLEKLARPEVVGGWHPGTKDQLRTVAAPLMHLIHQRGEDSAYRFDLTMTRLQTAQVQDSGEREGYKAAVQEQVENLQMNLNPVKAKAETIKLVRSKAFWQQATMPQLEDLRVDLRGIMRHQTYAAATKWSPLVLDVRDSGEIRDHYQTKLEGLQLVEYRKRVKKALLEHFEKNLVLRKIRANIRVSDADVTKLAELVMDVDPRADLSRLFAEEEHEDVKDRLQFVIRGLVGLNAEQVEQAFTDFVHAFSTLTAQQIQFLTLVKQHITDHGMLRIEDLYEAPFTRLHSDGVDGVFTEDEQVDRLLNIIQLFDPANVQSTRAIDWGSIPPDDSSETPQGQTA